MGTACMEWTCSGKLPRLYGKTIKVKLAANPTKIWSLGDNQRTARGKERERERERVSEKLGIHGMASVERERERENENEI